jgi:hypothetical protein
MYPRNSASSEQDSFLKDSFLKLRTLCNQRTTTSLEILIPLLKKMSIGSQDSMLITRMMPIDD